MDKLFDLRIYINEIDHEDELHIGLFATKAEADAVAERYLREVSGFKDYDCIPGVIEFPVNGGVDHTTQVYRFIGWNVDENLDEIDIIISNCFADLDEAERELTLAQKRLLREEWALNRHVIGECDWAEGFVRC